MAAGALVVLLAAGFGALGGKPSASQAAVAANGASPGAAGTEGSLPGLAPGQTPAVTPWGPCSEPPAGVPNVLLEIDGIPYGGSIEVLRTPSGFVPPQTAIPDQDRLFVSSNVPAELWIEGGVCAVAWDIGLGFARIDSLGNAGLNPLYAAQNRFGLFLAPFGGTNDDLTAELTFQNTSIRATWPINVVPYEHPSAYIVNDSDAGGPVEGCNVALTLHDRQTTIGEPCSDDLGALPEGQIPVQPGEELRFGIGGWTMESTSVICGRLSGQLFVADPAAKCDDGELAMPQDGEGQSEVIISAPRAKGTWTLAIQACASNRDWLGFNEICGTWYENVEVRPAIAG